MQLTERAKKLLTEDHYFAVVSTLMPDGSPQSSVVWIDSDGENVLFNTAEGRVKPRNLRRDPRVSVTIYDPENPFETVSIRGRAVEITTEGADEHIDKLAKKYTGNDRYPFRQPGEQRLLVRIVPDRITPAE